MLLNEFLKEHYKVQEQAASITQLTVDCGAAEEGLPSDSRAAGEGN